MLRIGSLTKAFTGQVLASLAADGTVKATGSHRLDRDNPEPCRSSNTIDRSGDTLGRASERGRSPVFTEGTRPFAMDIPKIIALPF